jgi:hypothetical protein
MKSQLFQSKQANPAATAVNNAGSGHDSVPLLSDPTQAPEVKEAAGSNWKRRWPATETIKPGTILYHGTESEFEEGDDLQMPAWFSAEREVAEWFAKRDGTRPGGIRIYKVTKPIQLPVINNKQELEQFFETFGIEAYGAEDMADGVVRAGLPGWVIPENYNPGNDILIVDGSAVQFQNVEPSRKTSAQSGEGDKIVRHLKQLGWKRPGRAGASVTDFKNPTGEDEIWVDWDQWRHMIRRRGWQELAHGTTLRELQIELKGKVGRQIMHDDSGASTGLRDRPDYGESDSYVSKMNDANSKGSSMGYVIALRNVQGVKEASDKAHYVVRVEYDPKNALKVAKFTFSPDRSLALVLPKLMAHDVRQQLNGAAFGVRATILAATDYAKMFGGLTQLVPKKLDRLIQSEIDWAKTTLKKLDRIVWYLRLYRLALTEQEEAQAKKQEQGASKVQPVPVQAAAPASPVPQQQGLEPQTPPPAPKPMLTQSQRLEKLRMRYVNELKSKGAGPDGLSIAMSDFPNMKRNLEHFYSLPIPDIQNKVLGAEGYGDLINSFRIAEEEWQEKAVRLIRPVQGDKVWMQFPNGWAWWFLPRSACELEAKAMGHCGNRPRADRSDQTILSLREPKQVGKETLWEPHLTFVLHGGGEEGTLGEMKGRNNDKPTKQYHPYIVALLKDPRIHGFIGATWLKDHNFRMSDLTEEQQREVFAANPNLAGGVKDYWLKNGMDERLIKQIKSLLELDEAARFDKEYGFILHQWPTEEKFINDCGDRNAKEAYAFVNGKEKSPLEPTNEDLIEFVMDNGDGSIIQNVGISLQQEFPKEAREWFGSERGEAYSNGQWHENEGILEYDPSDKDQVKRFLELLLEPYFTTDKAVYPDSPRVHNERDDEPDPKQYKYRKVKTLDEIRNAYYWGSPNIDSVGQYLDDSMYDLTQSRSDEGTILVDTGTPDGYYQVLGEEDAVNLAEKVALENEGAPSIDKPTVSVPDGWDTWDEEQGTEGLKDIFAQPKTYPTTKDKRQKRLFPEPKDEETAKRRGIAISSLRSPLWWA